MTNAKSQAPSIHLPSRWNDTVRSAVLHVISLAQVAAARTRGWAAYSVNARVRLKAEKDRLQQQVLWTLFLPFFAPVALLRQWHAGTDAASQSRFELLNAVRRHYGALVNRLFKFPKLAESDKSLVCNLCSR